MTIKLFIDPGHGGNDPGAVGNGLKEKDITLYLARMIKKYLDENYTGHTVMLSRSGDTTLTLADRTNKANAWKADYFLSIHVNAGGGTGYEDFVYSNTDTHTEKLRSVIHNEIKKAMPDWRNRGKKKANFHVLRESKMPAMLSENGFIDSKTDSDKLKDYNVLNDIARGHALGLVKAFNLKKKTATAPKTDTLYKVQVGAFAVKANAEKLAEELKKKGYPTYITK